MVDKAALAVVVPLLKISYGMDELTSVEVIHKIIKFVSLNQQIHLILIFPACNDLHVDNNESYEHFRFDATLDMQNVLVKNSMCINKKEIIVLKNMNIVGVSMSLLELYKYLSATGSILSFSHVNMNLNLS